MPKNILLYVGITILFLGTCITPSVTVDYVKKSSISVFKGNTLYVGGNGTGNYSKIQDAIDNTSDGDTVFVFDDSSPYYENIIISSSISLIGEDKNTTVIDGNMLGDVIRVGKGNYITGFTIKNCGANYNPPPDCDAGIDIHSNNNIITGNIIINNNNAAIYSYGNSNNIISDNFILENNGCGIAFLFSYNTTITNNIILNNTDAGILIAADDYKFNSISNNIVKYNEYGVILSSSHNKIITGNTIMFNNEYGIHLTDSTNNSIHFNTIQDNKVGIQFIFDSFNNTIFWNNFINNTINANDECNNIWDHGYPSGGNYWSDYKGKDDYHGYNQDVTGPDGIGDTSYNISQNLNQDRYPLMFPYDWPFQPIYLGLSEFYFGKTRLGSGYELHGHSVIYAKFLNVNSSLDELPLKIVLYFTVEMNYTMLLPFALSPLIAFGLQILNYSDYSWNAMKLKHHGHWIWNENVTQEIIIHPKDFKKGDELKLYVNISNIHVPTLNSPGNTKSWENILRIIFNTPVINKLLLYRWALPFLAPYNMINLEPLPAIVLRFQ